MLRFTKLLALLSLVCLSSAAAVAPRNDILVRAGTQGLPQPNSSPTHKSPKQITGHLTDSSTISTTIHKVNQKTGPTDNAPPSNSVPPTVITALDGKVTTAGQSGSALLNVLHHPSSQPSLVTGSTVSKGDGSLRKRGTYELVFSGTGTDPSDRDASIQGTAYLTFTRLDTYDINACEAFCDGIAACVFVNIFYEYNSDATYNPQIKCAAYADIHTAAEKTNSGGQQLLPSPAGTSYIQQSAGYAATTLADPAVPAGYELVFGPTGGANQSPGYMGFALLDKYDVQACADLCNSRGADPSGGACQYFNIWRALVNGNPTSYTCSMYYTPTDQSTATNTGQGDLQVTYSRGYKRITILPDGGFEDAVCTVGVCYIQSDATWIATSSPGGNDDALIFYDSDLAHTGNVLGTFGNPGNADDYFGTLTPAAPLDTVQGETYSIGFFHSSAYDGPTYEASANLQVLWNGATVLTITGYEEWTYHQVTVTAAGNDLLAFHGGSAPAFGFIDDIYVFLA